MSYFISLLKRSFWVVFSDKRSFFQMVLIPIFPMLLAVMLWGILYTLFRLSWINLLELNIALQIFWVICGLVLFIWFLYLSVVCSYLGSRAVYNSFIGTKESYVILFSHYKQSWKYLTTGISLALYVIWWVLLACLSFFFWFIHEYFFVVAAIFVFWVYVYAMISQNFTYAFFFFENKTDFSAVHNSASLVRKYWWKTFWLYALGGLLIAIFIGIFFGGIFLLDMGLRYIDITLPVSSQYVDAVIQVMQTLLQTVISIWGMAFTFSLFTDYQKHSSIKNIPEIAAEKDQKKKTMTSKKTIKTKK